MCIGMIGTVWKPPEVSVISPCAVICAAAETGNVSSQHDALRVTPGEACKVIICEWRHTEPPSPMSCHDRKQCC